MTTRPFAIKRLDGYDDGLVDLTRRGSFTDPELSQVFRDGIRRVFGHDLSAREVVDRILADVRSDGNAAVRRYTEAFDGPTGDTFEVCRQEWRTATERIDPNVASAMKTAAERIRRFHQRQPNHSWFDQTELGTFGQMVRPLERIGIYTPGGSAAYPSSLLMTAIPAMVAGVKEVIVASPPERNGRISDAILAAAEIGGVDRVFAIGGAQAIAALAFGTETIPHVDKLFGPGNIFVTLAKQRVFGVVDIDQLAGPTETLILADAAANLELVAADMIAQAEHDTIATAILITTSPQLASEIDCEIERQIATLERAEIIRTSLSSTGRVVVVDSIDQGVELANAFAPEHLCLLVERPWDLLPLVRNAGGVFIGEDSPEALGDYAAGPSHVMPTGGTARYSSPIHVGEFQKVISLIAANSKAVQNLGGSVESLANAEGLTGHAAAIRRRTSEPD